MEEHVFFWVWWDWGGREIGGGLGGDGEDEGGVKEVGWWWGLLLRRRLLLPLRLRLLAWVGLLGRVGGWHGLLVLICVKLGSWVGSGLWLRLGLGIGLGLRVDLDMGRLSERIQRGSYWTDWTV